MRDKRSIVIIRRIKEEENKRKEEDISRKRDQIKSDHKDDQIRSEKRMKIEKNELI